jgi:hypothetical protein
MISVLVSFLFQILQLIPMIFQFFWISFVNPHRFLSLHRTHFQVRNPFSQFVDSWTIKNWNCWH